MLAPTVHHRALTLALALLLLLTQQLGAQHRALHGRVSAGLTSLSAASATVAAWLPVSAAVDPATDDPAAPDGNPADTPCQVCLLLAALTLAAVPALLRWLGQVLRSPTPRAPPAWRQTAAMGRPYQARAPPH